MPKAVSGTYTLKKKVEKIVLHYGYLSARKAIIWLSITQQSLHDTEISKY